MNRRYIVTIGVILVFILAACDDNGEDLPPTEPPLAGALIPTRAPTNTPSHTPTHTTTPTSTATPTVTATNTPTSTPVPTDTPIPTNTATSTPTLTNTPAPTETPEPTATPAPTETPIPVDTATATAVVFDADQSGGEVEYGDTARGAITNAVFEVEYTFFGTAGDIVTIALIADPEVGDLDPFLSLIGPDGDEVAFNDDLISSGDADAASSRNSVIPEFELPTTGEYTIVATRFSRELGSTQGEYDLSLTGEATAVVDDGMNFDDMAFIEVGDTVTGSITDEEPVISYAFDGVEGETISIQMTATSGNLDTLVAIWDANGNELIFNDDDQLNNTFDSFLRDFVIPEDGIYVIRATRFEREVGESEGIFRLSLLGGEDEEPLIFEEREPIDIAIGERVDGNLNVVNFTQTYLFDGEAGQQVTVFMEVTSNNLLPLLILLDIDGKPIARMDSTNGDGFIALLDQIELPSSGEYTIVAGRTDTNLGITSGDYALELTEGAGNTQQASLVRDIDYGDTLAGDLDVNKPEEVYTFFAERGEVITATMRTTRGDLDTVLILTDALGNEIARNDDNLFDEDSISNSEIFNVLLTETGYYMLIATAFDTDNIDRGSYTLDLVRNEVIFDEELPLFAVLSPFNSGAVLADGSERIYNAVGDWDDVLVDAVLTFHLPRLEDDDTIDEAYLDLTDCFITADEPFETFDELTIFDNGRFRSNAQIVVSVDPRDSLGDIDDCQDLDVTQYIEQAYEEGFTVVQFLLTFEDGVVVENEAIDIVAFTSPYLAIYLDDE